MNIIHHTEPRIILLHMLHSSMYGSNKQFLVLFNDIHNEIKSIKSILRGAYNELREECEIFNPSMRNNTLHFQNYMKKTISKIYFRNVNEIAGLYMRHIKLDGVLTTVDVNTREFSLVRDKLMTALGPDGKIVVV